LESIVKLFLDSLNVAESNWALAAGLVPVVELKVFRTPQQVALKEKEKLARK